MRHALPVLLAALVCALGQPAYASLSFNVTFASSITSDATYGATIESEINSVLSIYEADISTNISVPITFGEMTTGLGQSSFFVDSVSYFTYCTDLKASATSASDATADSHLGTCGSTNPVNGTGNVDLKYADANAVGINDTAPGGSDGTVQINTKITDGGTGPCASSCFAFDSVLKHEVDEILGLGSGLTGATSGTVPFSTDPWAEDLFRYSGNGVRSYDAGVSCGSLGSAYFSIDGGATNLAGFNNACNGGDFGDWDLGSARVQNYAASPGSNPSLGVELTVLDVTGYTLTSTTPEPAPLLLTGSALGLLALIRKRWAAKQ